MFTNVSPPEWLTAELFTNIIAVSHENFLKIKKLKTTAVFESIENSVTKLLRIIIKFKLKDGTKTRKNFILKIPFNEEYRLLFLYENDMYQNVVKELENICFKNGNKVEFKAKTFYFTHQTTTIGDYILMEDLHERNFRNTNRLLGLNENETKLVLHKLAQWHAASMKRVEDVGEYSEAYRDSYFIEDERQLIEKMNECFLRPFAECLIKTNLSDDIKKKTFKYLRNLVQHYLNFGKVDPKQINVLNHGDLWLNNLMFQCNDFNNLLDVIFIDFQMPKYGNPAQDLFWLLLSSPAWDIRLEKFEQFIAFYHGSLISHLRSMNYCSSLPTLSQLNERLREGSVWAFITVQRLLPIALMDTYENSNIETFLKTNKEGYIARMRLFYNKRYVLQIEKIIPWLIDKEYLK